MGLSTSSRKLFRDRPRGAFGELPAAIDASIQVSAGRDRRSAPIWLRLYEDARADQSNPQPAQRTWPSRPCSPNSSGPRANLWNVRVGG